MRRPTIKERDQAEARARASIEARYGHPLTDVEWQEAKANLKAFFVTLAQWQLRDAAVFAETDGEHRA